MTLRRALGLLTYNFKILRHNHHDSHFIFPSLRLLPSLDSHWHMSSSPLPQWHSPTKWFHSRISRRRNGFIYSFNSIPGIGTFIGTFLLVGLIFYMTFLSPRGLLLLSTSKWSIPTNHTSWPSSPSASDVLSLQQIRDIVAPTRGFFSRDYSLYLGWNNVSICGNLSVIRAELMIPK